MKKISLAVIALAMSVALPVHAISASYRAKLERSGCTQLTESDGSCDINKTKEQNAAWSRYLDQVKEAESIIGTPISSAADYLLSKGWKPNNGEWAKNHHTLRVIVENGVVANAQLVK